MSTEWIQKKRVNWPDGSRRRVLDELYPGCDSAFEASQKVRNKTLNQTALQTPINRGSSSGRTSDFDSENGGSIPSPRANDYEQIKTIIEDIGNRLEDFDISTMNQAVRERLANMPLTTIPEAQAWHAAWLKVLAGR